MLSLPLLSFYNAQLCAPLQSCSQKSKIHETSPCTRPPLFQHACVLCGLRPSLNQHRFKYIHVMAVLDTDTAKSQVRYLVEIMGRHSSHLAPVTERVHTLTAARKPWAHVYNWAGNKRLFLSTGVVKKSNFPYRSSRLLVQKYWQYLGATLLQILQSPLWGVKQVSLKKQQSYRNCQLLTLSSSCEMICSGRVLAAHTNT